MDHSGQVRNEPPLVGAEDHHCHPLDPAVTVQAVPVLPKPVVGADDVDLLRDAETVQLAVRLRHDSRLGPPRVDIAADLRHHPGGGGTEPPVSLQLPRQQAGTKLHDLLTEVKQRDAMPLERLHERCVSEVGCNDSGLTRHALDGCLDDIALVPWLGHDIEVDV